VIEHGTSRYGRWLRERRVRVALWVAVIEGILILVHTIPVWIAIVIGLVVCVVYFTAGDRIRSDTVHQVGWIAAVSQALVLFVPVLVAIVWGAALLVVLVLALVALALLFSDRR
jgi:hypothetical protein